MDDSEKITWKVVLASKIKLYLAAYRQEDVGFLYMNFPRNQEVLIVTVNYGVN